MRKLTPKLDRGKPRGLTDARKPSWSAIAQHRALTAMTTSSLMRNLGNPKPSDGAVDPDENGSTRGARSGVLIRRNACLSLEQSRRTAQPKGPHP